MFRIESNRPLLYVVCSRFLVGDRDYIPCIRAILEGGADIVQMREKRMPRVEARELARAMADVVGEFGREFVVNDDAELAAELGAGLHVGQDDETPEAARRLLGPDALIGLSTHTRDQIAAAATRPVDLIGVGPIFDTNTKDAGMPVGLELARYASMSGGPPAFPIGGIDLDGARRLAEAGIRRAAVSSYVLASPDPGGAVAALLDALAG